MPLNLDPAKIKKYAAIGLGAFGAIIILRRIFAPKIEQDQKTGSSPAVEGVSLLTSDYTPAQAAAFKAALPERAKPYGNLFVEAGRRYGVSPLVLAGIMYTETGYGSICTDAACRGATKHDWGLMQINDEAHPVFFKTVVNGRPAYEDPASSVMYAAKVLRATTDFFTSAGKSGQYKVTVGRALKYGCKPGMHPDPRPLTGEMRLVAGVASYNTGPGNVVQALACGLSADVATHNGKYADTALGEAKRLLSLMGTGVS